MCEVEVGIFPNRISERVPPSTGDPAVEGVPRNLLTSSVVLPTHGITNTLQVNVVRVPCLLSTYR
jgi:hypothetical protein